MKSALYLSKACTPFDQSALVEMQNFAAEMNGQYGISGYLYFEKGHFIQYIEGPDDAIDQLISNLRGDSRHEVLQVVEESNLTERRFEEWAMRWLDHKSIAQIQMEHLLLDQLNAMSKSPAMTETFSRSVYRMVGKLASVKNLFAAR